MGLAIDIPAIFRPNAQEINLITAMGAAQQRPLSVQKFLLLAEAVIAAFGKPTDDRCWWKRSLSFDRIGRGWSDQIPTITDRHRLRLL
jgi:hypothetical protein